MGGNEAISSPEVKPQMQEEPHVVEDIQHSMSPQGVSIQFIRHFVDSHKSSHEFSTFTTTDACKNIVLVETKERQCAYIDLFIGKTEQTEDWPYIAPATVFVSHAWKYNIVEVIDAMEQYEVLHPNSYFWFDLFINNQNNTASVPQEWWSTTFRTSIKTIGSVLLILSPWDDQYH